MENIEIREAREGETVMGFEVKGYVLVINGHDALFGDKEDMEEWKTLTNRQGFIDS